MNRVIQIVCYIILLVAIATSLITSIVIHKTNSLKVEAVENSTNVEKLNEDSIDAIKEVNIDKPDEEVDSAITEDNEASENNNDGSEVENKNVNCLKQYEQGTYIVLLDNLKVYKDIESFGQSDVETKLKQKTEVELLECQDGVIAKIQYDGEKEGYVLASALYLTEPNGNYDKFFADNVYYVLIDMRQEYTSTRDDRMDKFSFYKSLYEKLSDSFINNQIIPICVAGNISDDFIKEILENTGEKSIYIEFEVAEDEDADKRGYVMDTSARALNAPKVWARINDKYKDIGIVEGDMNFGEDTFVKSFGDAVSAVKLILGYWTNNEDYNILVDNDSVSDAVFHAICNAILDAHNN